MRSEPLARSRRRAVAVAGVVALGLVAGLAACGSDGGEKTTSGGVTTTTSADAAVSTTGATEGTTDDGLPPKVEMSDAQSLIGLTEDDAQAKADDAGWTLRVLRIDGEDLPATNDYNPERVNVSVTDGKVDSILSIG